MRVAAISFQITWKYEKSWEIVDSEKRNMHWDVCRCELNADINSAEVENLIEAVCLKLPIKTKYKIT